ncbi:hypothetical protein DFH07DRAFT_915121 [Mycena maculata]|uniref:Mitochondrial import inner membrane translocase subunit TIM50 n=1 Tax=Mycena maculata TaxID=230809 RepID=A0AAD7JQA1_9AGAR|nr:hypothetical protein DFH07DRAFT_915121 [Mycena maculata]
MSSQVSKKLLVLDLNGTLLLRSKHTRQGPYLPGGLRSRLVHPRPFLNSFREYIFHPSTMVWLDTMVWSSAQPPSVADMVNHCFGDQQRKFLAIWARDTLGLSPALYNCKTQTTKDLEKPWAAFPEHSARTTLLLDDSVRKAHLHPNNHVCVREYLQETRMRDVELWKNRKLSAGASKRQKQAKQAKAKSKKMQGADLSAPLDALPAWVLSSSKYDETLLAVIGILETIKAQPDLADWIRGGGLLKETPGQLAEQAQTSRPPSPDALASQMATMTLQELWFNSEVTVGHWVAEGLHALEALQIDVVVGIHTDPPH